MPSPVWRVLSLAALAWLSGCYPTTPETIRERPASRAEFTVDANYQEVYRRIVPAARRCGGESVWIGHNEAIRAELYTDIRKAEIAQESQNMVAGRGIIWLVEIEAVSDQQTKVTILEGLKHGMDRRIRAWADGSMDCSAPPQA